MYEKAGGGISVSLKDVLMVLIELVGIHHWQRPFSSLLDYLLIRDRNQEFLKSSDYLEELILCYFYRNHYLKV